MKKLKPPKNTPARIPLLPGRFLVVWVIIAVMSAGGPSKSFSAVKTESPP
jgi:hypothetical protein